ncbi:MAG: heme-binding protein [Gammaproteobacteria bacterium]
MKSKYLSPVFIGLLGLSSGQIMASDNYAKRNNCEGLPSHSELTQVLRDNVAASGGPSNGGLDFNMWATVVNRDGVVCAVTFSGDDRGSQWPGSRVISAQKANTANAFSLDGLALSTANLFSAVQPGGSLFGLQHSNPVDASVAYGKDGSPGNEGRAARRYGQRNDPLVGDIPGGVNVFGGGLALYNDYGKVIGALGVSGDTSCADHNVAWRTREALGLNNTPGGVGPNGQDGIFFLVDDEAPNGFKHPTCLNAAGEITTAESIGSGGDGAP